MASVPTDYGVTLSVPPVVPGQVPPLVNGDKLNAYRRNGVREYVVWRVWDKAIDWFVLEGGQFVKQPLGEDGVYRSRVMPGLWLDAKAALAGDLAQALEVLQEGLASDEHQTFAGELEKKLAS